MLWVVQNSKNLKIEADVKTKNKTTMKQAKAYILFFAVCYWGLYLSDHYLKEEKHLYLEDISDYNKAFLKQGWQAHKNIFMDKLTNILQILMSLTKIHKTNESKEAKIICLLMLQ